jgi:hypothetical protein
MCIDREKGRSVAESKLAFSNQIREKKRYLYAEENLLDVRLANADCESIFGNSFSLARVSSQFQPPIYTSPK